jgi:hypothetical protein
MKRLRDMAAVLAMVLAAVVVMVLSCAVQAAEPLKVTVDENNALSVNGKKFLPIAVWAQPEDTFAMWQDLGANLFMTSSNPRKEGNVATYLKAAEEHNAYVSIGYRWAKREGKLDEVMKHPLVFTLHHNDEPDKPTTQSDAKIEPGTGMRVNGQRPLFTVLDGKLNTSAVIDPPQGVEFTITLPKAVTVAKFAAAIDVGSYSSPKELEFVAGGKSLLKVELKKATGLQEFPLPEPATFTALTVKVLSAHEGSAKFGGLAEVQGLDAAGKNVLLSEARKTAIEMPEEVQADYKAIKAADPGRLVSLCIMSRFMDEVKFDKIPMEMYKQYPPATDLLMFDLYPTQVYKGKNLHWNALGLDKLRELAGPKKVLGIWLQASDAMDKDDPGMTPTQMRADAWLALIHGATFIGYFPQTFPPAPVSFKFHDLNAERRASLKATNKEITELTDLILTAPKTDLFAVKSEGGRVDAMQRESGDKALLVLVNVIESGEGKPVTVTIEPKSFKAADAPVRYGTKDALTAKGGEAGKDAATAKAGPWTVELKPWETAVLVVDREK